MKHNQKARATTDSFSAQYQTSEWKARREEILQIDRHRCRRCGSSKKLAVHHLHYIPNHKAWEYEDSHLMTLCESCHLELHRYKDEINESLILLMSNWCLKEDSDKANYFDAFQILKMMAEMSADKSKNFVQIALDVAFRLDGGE